MRKELLRMVRDRRALILSLFIPFFLMLLVGTIFKTADTRGGATSSVKVHVYVEEQGPSEQGILNVMQQTPGLQLEIKNSAQDARTPVEQGDRSAAVILPAGLSAAIAQGKQASIVLLTTPSSNDYRA